MYGVFITEAFFILKYSLATYMILLDDEEINFKLGFTDVGLTTHYLTYSLTAKNYTPRSPSFRERSSSYISSQIGKSFLVWSMMDI